MVNTLNVSRYTDTPPTSDSDNDRKIEGGPLYPAADVRQLLGQQGNNLIAWTNKCQDDMQRNSLELADVDELIQACFSRRSYFKGSWWCKQKPGGPWAACDSYQIFVMRWNDSAWKDLEYEYYIKFAIAKTGKVLLTVSCHGPEERY